MMRAEAGGSSYRYREIYRRQESARKSPVSERRTAVKVPKRTAEKLLRAMLSAGILDESRKISKRDGSVVIPLTSSPEFDVATYGAELLREVDLPPRLARTDPAARLEVEFAKERIPKSAIPRKWRRLGDVVIFRLPPEARKNGEAVGRIFAEALAARTIVEDRSGIHGPLRTPDVRLLWGDETETVHVEAGIRYRLDVSRVMFSPGNTAERIGIAQRVRPGDVVVDLFAGIGYFTLPIALRSKPSMVYACELNPVAFRYLVENIRLNRADHVVPLLGDCRETAPKGVADWVLMGHFDARDYLDVGFRCLRGRGTIVYHDVCPKEHVPEEPIRRIAAAAPSNWMRVVGIEHRIVKSYAPGIVHVVIHARVEPTMRHR